MSIFLVAKAFRCFSRDCAKIIFAMYNVIIVDDEATVRERLLGFLNRHADEFKVIGTYENGYDAMMGGIPLEPDLIITDIKMPFITGLELIKQAKQELPLVQAIIVSGYDDFDFAKQAIDLGVVGYISKPVTFEEISDALNKAKIELDKKYSIDKNIKDLQERNESVLKMVQSDDLNKLVTLKSIPANFREKLKADGIGIDEPYVLFAIFDSDQDEDELSFEDSELVNYYLSQYIGEEFATFSYTIFESGNSKSVLLGSKTPFNKEELQARFARVIAKIKRTCGVSFSAGVSDFGETEEIGSYRKLYRHARWTLEYRTVVGANIALFYSDLETSKNNGVGKVDENEYKAIAYAILYGKRDDAVEAVNKLVDTISSIEYKDSYFLIVNNLLDSMLKSCVAIDQLYSTYLPHVGIVNEIFSSKSPESTKTSFERLIDKILEINTAQRTSGVDDAYSHIRHYIEGNYQKSTLSLDDVANELGYSVSYISAILKRHDTSFTKYLTQVRMEQAKLLLADPNKKLIVIANEIGYDDPYYFSHCFKKCFGVSPVEYRKS
jgi:two-component system response regulator YesN